MLSRFCMSFIQVVSFFYFARQIFLTIGTRLGQSFVLANVVMFEVDGDCLFAADVVRRVRLHQCGRFPL